MGQESPPNIPEVKIPEDMTVNIALSLRHEINRGLFILREIGHGCHLKKYLIVIGGIWVLSVLGSCCNFLTLSYIDVGLHSCFVARSRTKKSGEAQSS
ncbi:Reticulon-like protein B1 [Hordeum vulgare]|nr:Reticulon-like protein B1 [Hordeum vulgare]